jgi:ATP-dependent Clp protease ATP-binding subunit ClpA
MALDEGQSARTPVFEKYTEQARRAVFFARHEALVRDWMQIEPEHLALGTLREADSTARQAWPAGAASPEDLQRSLERSLAPPVPGRTYEATTTFSERSGHEHVGLEHLLVGLVTYERTFWSRIGGGFVLKAFLVRQGLDQHTLETHARTVNASS